MKTGDLITALQPLAGWYIRAASYKLSKLTPCYTIRELGGHERERQHGRDVILVTGLATDEEYPDFPPGIVFSAENVVRADWAGDRVWIEAKHKQLGYIQRVRPIETTESNKGVQDAV